jgi:uncharacterized protein (TIGR02246 family)
MHRLFLAIAMFSMLSFGQSKTEQQVLKADDDWARATVKGDAAVLEAVLHEDLIYIHSNGEADTRAQYIDNLKTGKRKYLTLDLEPARVRIFGDSAVITRSAKVQTSMQGKAADPVHLAFLHSYVREKGRWRMVAHQSTRLPK